MAIPRHHQHALRGESANSPIGKAYLIGVVGVGLALLLAIVVATEAGWLTSLKSNVPSLRLPALPSLGASSTGPMAGLNDILDSVVGLGKSREDLTSRSFERAQGIVGGLSADVSPSNRGARR